MRALFQEVARIWAESKRVLLVEGSFEDIEILAQIPVKELIVISAAADPDAPPGETATGAKFRIRVDWAEARNSKDLILDPEGIAPPEEVQRVLKKRGIYLSLSKTPAWQKLPEQLECPSVRGGLWALNLPQPFPKLPEQGPSLFLAGKTPPIAPSAGLLEPKHSSENSEELESLKEELERLRVLEQQGAEKQEQRESLERAFQELETSFGSVRADRDRLQEESETLKATEVQVGEEFLALEAQLKDVQAQLKKAKERSEAQESQLEQAQTQYEAQNAQLKSLKAQAQEQLKAAEVQAQKQLKAVEIQAQEQLKAAEVQAQKQLKAVEIQAQEQLKAAEIQAQKQLEVATTQAQKQREALEAQLKAAETQTQEQREAAQRVQREQAKDLESQTLQLKSQGEELTNLKGELTELELEFTQVRDELAERRVADRRVDQIESRFTSARDEMTEEVHSLRARLRAVEGPAADRDCLAQERDAALKAGRLVMEQFCRSMVELVGWPSEVPPPPTDPAAEAWLEAVSAAVTRVSAAQEQLKKEQKSLLQERSQLQRGIRERDEALKLLEVERENLSPPSLPPAEPSALLAQTKILEQLLEQERALQQQTAFQLQRLEQSAAQIINGHKGQREQLGRARREAALARLERASAEEEIARLRAELGLRDRHQLELEAMLQAHAQMESLLARSLSNAEEIREEAESRRRLADENLVILRAELEHLREGP